jgi:hypothetical protein
VCPIGPQPLVREAEAQERSEEEGQEWQVEVEEVE